MCGLPSVYFLFGALSGKEWSIPVLSHEGPFGVGYGVCLCLPEEADGRKEAYDIRVRLARDSIAEYLKTGKLPKPPADIPEELKERAGVFVSLHEFGALRGCIGRSFPSEIRRLRKSSITQKPRRVRPAVPARQSLRAGRPRHFRRRPFRTRAHFLGRRP